MVQAKAKYRYNSTVRIKQKKKKRIIYRNLITDETYINRFSKFGKPLRLPLPKIVIKADEVFSLWIRNREKRCVLCGRPDQLTNGHLFKRGKKYIRWDEYNCHTLCKGCNKLDNQEHDHYVLWFIDKYGLDKYKDLYAGSEAEVTSIWIRDKALQVIKKYRLK